LTGNHRTPRHPRNNYADTTAIASDSQVHSPEYILELQVISLKESAFQQRPRNLESNEVVIAIGCVPVLGNLHHIKSEFGANVRFGVVRVGDLLAIFLRQAGELNGRYAIDDGMSATVRGGMTQRAQGEGV